MVFPFKSDFDIQRVFYRKKFKKCHFWRLNVESDASKEAAMSLFLSLETKTQKFLAIQKLQYLRCARTYGPHCRYSFWR